MNIMNRNLNPKSIDNRCELNPPLIVIIDNNGTVRIIGNGQELHEISNMLCSEIEGEVIPKVLAGNTVWCG